MRDYLVIETAAGADTGSWRACEARVLASGGWSKVAERRGFSVFLEAARPPAYRHLPNVAGSLIGDVFDADAARRGVGARLEPQGFGGDPATIAQRLADRAFGRYVAILDDGEGPARVLRDPLGVMEAIGWRRGPLRFIASRLPDLPELWPVALAIDFDRLAAILRQKNLASLISPLAGVVSYRPGVLSGPDGEGACLWSPARFARRPAAADPAGLRAVLDGAVSAWALGRQGVFCEISGGLDSAIVATSLARTSAAPLYGLNHAFARAESDERLYAQAVADAIGVRLEVVERAPLRLDPAKLAGAAGGAKLNYVGGDPDHDADLAQRLRAPNVEAMFTGRGGDGVFYQSRHPVLVPDVLAGRAGVGRLRGLDLLARRNATTVWSLVRQGLSAQDMTAGLGLGAFLTDGAAAGAARLHPWLEEARALAPAKQLQILALVNGLSAFGESQRHQAGDVIDPLMSQPVVEFCLSVAAGRLAVGDNDRPFARAAFAERLPPLVLGRQGKGDLTTWFARALGESLEPLRAWLLGGRLVEAGLIDRDRLNQALDVGQLVWTSITSEVFVLMAAEAWVRRWEARLARARPAAA
ncbi:asparagine synthase C-terminal domain-containing protein [Caulobacter segnis]|uniref:asparagine synthase C-terminal domain-containing protein n=1 Tax=Caulobacter segnis TaxID=88688 RepID=UPI0028595605|nr:asparagine synthase C-terminal domain-containing protein [Caulobacter segnis]MDR6623865.1 asparagine synthase (glutamine-hydrolyzing) [Caulobacter segnis]